MAYFPGRKLTVNGAKFKNFPGSLGIKGSHFLQMPQPQLQASHGFLHQEGLTRSIHHITCNLQSWMGAAGALPGPASLRTEVPRSAKLIPHTRHCPLPRPFPGPSSPAFCCSQGQKHASHPQLSALAPPPSLLSRVSVSGGRGASVITSAPVTAQLTTNVTNSAPPESPHAKHTSAGPPSPHRCQLWPCICQQGPQALRAGGVLGAAQAADADWTQSRPAPLSPHQEPTQAHSLSLSS